MLEFVIKRHGAKEPFSVEKINHWALYSAQKHNIKTGEWIEAVQRALQGKGSVCTTEALQRSLINALLEINTWGAILMAGTLEASMLQKKVFPEGVPSVSERFMNLNVMWGMMIEFPFTKEEWQAIDAMIDHDLDQNLPQFAIDYISTSYALYDVKTKQVLETPQFTYMRMACAVGSSYPEGQRIPVIEELYYLFSNQVVSAPTPNWTNLGTPNNGLASCCLYTADDDRRSLAAADHISYVMTYMSAGLGYHHSVRSVGDPVRGGTIEHQGEISYLKSIAASAAANRQKKRGGAVTGYVSGYSKEVKEIVGGRNPLAPIDSALRGIDAAVVINDDLLTRGIKSKPSLHFTKWSHPELYELMHKPNWHKEFEAKMEECIATADESELFNPRQVVGSMGKVAFMSGRLYSFFVDNANRHTSFKESIYSSNLCLEICQPTKPYQTTSDLYRTDDDVTGEVSLCNIGAINHAKVADNPELHRRACMGALRMIDYCIHHGYYELPHVGYTAKKRNNAGIGVMNTAAYMAKNGLKYNSVEGLRHMHSFAEKHSYFLIESSLELAKEKGNAEWIDKTRWAGYTDKDGNHIKAWMPIDTGNTRVADMHGFELEMDWEDLRDRVAEQGGIRNSSLFAIMPGESSSKALGASSSIYPVRNLGLDKTDSTSRIQWVAEGAGTDEYDYQIAFDLTDVETIHFYSVWQRFADQGISADFWKDLSSGGRSIKTNDLLRKYKLMSNFGLKSHYYLVPKTQMTVEEMMALDTSMSDEDSPAAGSGGEVVAFARPETMSMAMDAPDFQTAVCGIDSGGCSA